MASTSEMGLYNPIEGNHDSKRKNQQTDSHLMLSDTGDRNETYRRNLYNRPTNQQELFNEKELFNDDKKDLNSVSKVDQPISQSTYDIDIFSDFAVIKVRYSLSDHYSYGLNNENVTLSLPSTAVLDTVKVYDDLDRIINYIIKPATGCNNNKIGSFVQVINNDGSIDNGVLVSLDPVTIVQRIDGVDRTVTISDINRIVGESVTMNSTVDLFNVQPEAQFINLEYAVKDINMCSDYHVDITSKDSKLSIIRRYRINNGRYDHIYRSIQLYGGNVSLKSGDELNSGYPLVKLNGPIELGGLVVSMNDPLIVGYSYKYEHIFGDKDLTMFYELISPKRLGAGNIRFYDNNRYIGSQYINGAKEGEKIRIKSGISSLRPVSKVIVKPIEKTSNDNKEELVILEISLNNTYNEQVTVNLVYLAQQPVISTRNYTPSKIEGNRYEWEVTFNPKETGKISLELTQVAND